MDQAAIYAGLTELFQEVFDDDSIVLRPDMSAKDLEGWDSFTNINLIVAAEARFKVKFKTAEIEGLANVGSLVGLIESKMR